VNRTPFSATAILLLTALAHGAMAQPGNATRGERMYRACVACHSLEPNRNMTGPSLAEVWNRKAGSLASFPRYSSALKSAGVACGTIPRRHHGPGAGQGEDPDRADLDLCP